MKKTKAYLKVKDHSVSRESFQLIKNSTYGYLETFPQPKADKLPNYYKTKDYISHTDAKRNLFEKIYHFVRSISLRKKLKLINSFNYKVKTLLDIGCGTGDFLKTAQKNDWNIVGIEPNESARQIANSKTNNTVLDSHNIYGLKEHSFNVITLWHVLEHLPNLNEHISLFKKLLKPDGTLIIAVPNYKSFDAKHYKSFWAAYDVPRHLWHFSHSSISKLFSDVNMQVVKTLPMKFDSYYVSLLSEKYQTGRMNIFRAFRVGLISNLKAKHSNEYSSMIYIIKNK